MTTDMPMSVGKEAKSSSGRQWAVALCLGADGCVRADPRDHVFPGERWWCTHLHASTAQWAGAFPPGVVQHSVHPTRKSARGCTKQTGTQPVTSNSSSLPRAGQTAFTCRHHLLCLSSSSSMAGSKGATAAGRELRAGRVSTRSYSYIPGNQRPKIQRHS